VGVATADTSLGLTAFRRVNEMVFVSRVDETLRQTSSGRGKTVFRHRPRPQNILATHPIKPIHPPADPSDN
jgi:hypothetical protein